jgi:hypothetical protein
VDNLSDSKFHVDLLVSVPVSMPVSVQTKRDKA